jgi:uncharacterized protein (DUF486 family)
MKVLTPALFLVVSNVFMTFAWYGHLKWFPQSRHASLAVIVAISWGIALLEYCFQVPGNRLGEQAGLTVGQLKVMQEIITLGVFSVFAVTFFPNQKLTWNYYAAFALMGGAAFLVFFRFNG